MEAETFVAVVCFLVLAMVVAGTVHLLIQKSMHDRLLDCVSEMQDGLAKIHEQSLIHMGSRNAFEAVEASAYNEQQKVYLQQAEEAFEEELKESNSKGRPVGVRSQDGNVYPFYEAPTREKLSKIPAHLIVWETDNDAKKLAT